jgi:hypothetical protein
VKERIGSITEIRVLTFGKRKQSEVRRYMMCEKEVIGRNNLMCPMYNNYKKIWCVRNRNKLDDLERVEWPGKYIFIVHLLFLYFVETVKLNYLASL